MFRIDARTQPDREQMDAFQFIQVERFCVISRHISEFAPVIEITDIVIGDLVVIDGGICQFRDIGLPLPIIRRADR